MKKYNKSSFSTIKAKAKRYSIAELKNMIQENDKIQLAFTTSFTWEPILVGTAQELLPQIDVYIKTNTEEEFLRTFYIFSKTDCDALYEATLEEEFNRAEQWRKQQLTWLINAHGVDSN